VKSSFILVPRSWSSGLSLSSQRSYPSPCQRPRSCKNQSTFTWFHTNNHQQGGTIRIRGQSQGIYLLCSRCWFRASGYGWIVSRVYLGPVQPIDPVTWITKSFLPTKQRKDSFFPTKHHIARHTPATIYVHVRLVTLCVCTPLWTYIGICSSHSSLLALHILVNLHSKILLNTSH